MNENESVLSGRLSRPYRRQPSNRSVSAVGQARPFARLLSERLAELLGQPDRLVSGALGHGVVPADVAPPSCDEFAQRQF